MSLKLAGSNAVESTLTGVISVGIDKLVYGYPLDSWALKKGLLSAGCSYSSESVTTMILPNLIKMGPTFSNIQAAVLIPIISGVMYVGMDNVFQWDNRSFLMKFLLQVGS